MSAHRTLTDYPFLLLWEPGLPWDTYIRLLDGLRDGSSVPDGLVPSTFLLAVDPESGALAGRASVRFALNELLAAEGGHIGYAVLPAFRRLGHATELLAAAVTIAREKGVQPILVFCDEDNVASTKVIERNGGVLESIVSPVGGGPLLRRYWID